MYIETSRKIDGLNTRMCIHFTMPILSCLREKFRKLHLLRLSIFSRINVKIFSYYDIEIYISSRMLYMRNSTCAENYLQKKRTILLIEFQRLCGLTHKGGISGVLKFLLVRHSELTLHNSSIIVESSLYRVTK